MANRYVRIYQGPENTNVIGFSASAVPETSDNFEGFLEGRGYEVKKYTWDAEDDLRVIHKIGGVSCAYYGIEPPLRSEDEHPLAEWCADNIYTGHNSGFLIDNRETPGPLKAFHYTDQRMIARWW